MWQFALVMFIILVFVVGLVSAIQAIERGKQVPEDPEELLRGRFARGEITEAEYARILAVLRYGPPLELPD
jgi:uncharacterized membrane protein